MDSHAALACGWDGCVSRVQIPLPPIPLYTQREKGRPPLPSLISQIHYRYSCLRSNTTNCFSTSTATTTGELPPSRLFIAATLAHDRTSMPRPPPQFSGLIQQTEQLG